MIGRPAPISATRLASLSSVLLLLFSSFLACAEADRHGIFGDDDDVADDDDHGGVGFGDDDDVADDDDDDDDDDAQEPFKIAGMVYVVPIYRAYDENDIWVRYELEWTDVHPGGYPYGLVYVGATPGFDNTQENLVGDVPPALPADPKNTGTPYLLEMNPWPLPEVAVMGVADTYTDGIISPMDAMAFHPDPIDTTGSPVKDADIYIDVEFHMDDGVWVPGGGGGGGGGWGGEPGCPGVDLSGHIFLHDSLYTTRDARSLVAIYDENLIGPWWTTLPGSLDGKAQDTMLEWDLTIPCDYTAYIYGAWDHNDNMLFEPTDEWGVTVTGLDGSEINPWYVTDVGFDGLLVQVPFALAPTPRPYIMINGVITTDGTFEFADLPAGSVLYVLASRYYLPSLHEFPIHVLQGEDKIWTQDLVIDVHLQGDSIPYQVWAPSDSSMILHAAIDTDGDGYVESMYVIDGPEGAFPTNVGDTMMTVNLVMTTSP